MFEGTLLALVILAVVAFIAFLLLDRAPAGNPKSNWKGFVGGVLVIIFVIWLLSILFNFSLPFVVYR